MAIVPVADTASLLTAESDRMVARGERMLRKSQTRVLRSSLPDTTLSSRANTAHVTALQHKGIY
jgi:hypothetical protein